MAVRMKGCYLVKPAEPTWNGFQSLSEWDQTGLITHVPSIYLYRPSQKWSTVADITNTLTQSLSRALVHFYPLAGRLRCLPGGRLELNCNAEGVLFTEVEFDSELDALGDLSPSSESCHHLAPVVDYTRPIHELPLLVIQLTRFSCGGIGLGLAISQAVVDGPSAMHFFSEWAGLARGEQLKTTPLLDRKCLRAGDLPLGSPCFNHVEFDSPPILVGQSNCNEERTKETTVAMLRVTKEQLKKLKRIANDGRDSKTTRPYTRYEMLAGHVWRCACKARKHSKEQATALAISVDVRNRIEPRIPISYLGNASFDVTANSSSEDLVSKPLSFAANKIRETVEKVTNDYIWSSIEYLKNQKDLVKFRDLQYCTFNEGPFSGNPNLSVVSWLRLPLYGLDFGWGNEVCMTHSCDIDGDVFLRSDPSCKDDGSLVVAICLQVQHMDSFKKHFYSDIGRLFDDMDLKGLS
ncbi:spermidine hydroxycinnamoyl transferase-like [Humulus lupulus]|uniref:spermidine hydroxycinnamoyl transferase-like n=1 Tax=Humulus lupulus TaxID=3486 RepID=UPI002B406BB1|nr:spermidine hydroxycinnamoyl transferase-like [Humulus lupulus]